MELLKYTIKEFYAQIDFAADNLKRAYEQITEPEQLEQAFHLFYKQSCEMICFFWI